MTIRRMTFFVRSGTLQLDIALVLLSFLHSNSDSHTYVSTSEAASSGHVEQHRLKLLATLTTMNGQSHKDGRLIGKICIVVGSVVHTY